MANSLTPLISEVINAISEVRFDQYAFTSQFSKDFMAEGALTGKLPALNDQVTLTGFTPTMYRGSGTAHTVSGRYYSVSTIYEANADIKYSDGYSVGASRLSEFEARVLQQKVREVLDSIQSGAYTALQNTSAVSSLPGCPNLVGTPGTAPFGTLYSDFVNATVALNRNNVPQDNRFVLCDLAAYSNLLNASGLWNESVGGAPGQSMLNSRIVPTRFGMPVAWENKVGRYTGYTGLASGSLYIVFTGSAGTGAKGTVTAYLYGSGAASGTTGLTLNPGDVFYFTGIDGLSATGYGQSYVVTSGATTTETGTGGKAQFTFWPPLRGSGDINCGITPVVGGYAMNLMAHRDAMKLIMRDPLQAMGGREVKGQHIRYVDPRTGVPLLISWYPGDMMGLWTVKALFQWVPWNPDYACIIAG